MLDHKFNSFRFLVISGICSLLLVYDAAHTSWRQHPCYAQAMIGSDSVINARLGVPVEDVLQLAERNEPTQPGELTYSIYMLNTVLYAYLWDKSPHHYSIKVFYQCANDSNMAKLFNPAVDRDG